MRSKSIWVKHNLPYAILLLLFLLSFSLKTHNLGHPERYYFDENFFAFTAQEMAKGNPLGWQKGERAPGKAEYEWTHPPLGKEISALGILIFGDKTSSWRIMQAFFGALGTLIIFFLARNLFNSQSAGIIASFLYTFESFIFVFSRIALVDIYLFNFLMLASLFFIKFSKSANFRYLILTALFAGAAMSVKWSGGFIAAFLFCLSIIVIFYKNHNNKYGKSTSIQLLKVVSIFLFMPLLIYLATYIPYFLNGNSLSDFISFQETMFSYHKNVSKQHAYRSEWWSWPLMIRPLCLYIEKIGNYREYIYAIGNPVIWWSGLLAIAISIYYAIRYRYYPLLFVVLSFFAYIVPWSISPRKVTYIYHYMPSLLFIILALSYFLDKIWQKSYRTKILVIYFLICVVVSFIFFYPILSGTQVPKSEMKNYRWMKTWR
ncbi:MAG: phospholipid carrier-dependent glycosyltransferase [Thermodesulfobacteriota bacterium]